MENPDKDDLIFGQFEKLTRQFIDLAGLNTKEQRVDSTQIMTNIKLAGRLSLAYDVLSQALAACPSELLTDSLKKVPEPEYKTKALYRSKLRVEQNAIFLAEAKRTERRQKSQERSCQQTHSH